MIAKLGLGKLMTTKTVQDQNNLVDFIFAVMLNNDKTMRNDLAAIVKKIEKNKYIRTQVAMNSTFQIIFEIAFSISYRLATSL